LDPRASIKYALWDHVILGAENDYVQLNADPHADLDRGGPLVPIHINAGVDIQALSARLCLKNSAADGLGKDHCSQTARRTPF
jgi:hypothetical protein